MQKTFLFYDIETSGLDKSYDQVQQFAAIRTDMDFNEIERYEIFVKINPDVIPSPEALIIHRVGIMHCQKMGLPEIEAIGIIHALLNTPNTISLGYNTLGFDDEFLRFSFHRNLLPPYTHQYANGCGRADLYPMAAMLRWQQADCIQWPENEGKPTLKLEHISTLNQLAQGQAHNAMVDVEATVALARCFAQSGATWEYLLGYFDKHEELKRIQSLAPFEPMPSCSTAMLIDGSFGSQLNYQCPVLYLGEHKHYRNQTLWLRLDTNDLSQLTPDNQLALPWVVRRKRAEPPFFIPDKPRFLEKLLPEQLALRQQNLHFLTENPSALQSLTAAHLDQKYPDLPPLDDQAGLYQSDFLSATDLQRCQYFHQAPLEHKWNAIKQFQRRDCQVIAQHILARHYPSLCPDEVKQAFAKYQLKMLTQAPLNHQGKPRKTIADFESALHECQHQPTLDGQQRQLLEEFEQYLNSIKQALGLTV